jgi:uncharacterized protein YhhL (DUF1145 family)
MESLSYKEYSTKVWFFTVFIAPLVIVLNFFIAFDYTFHDINEAAVIALYIMGIGIILSLPSLGILILAHRALRKSKMPTIGRKLSILLFGIVLILGTFYLLDKHYTTNGTTESRIIIGGYIAVFGIAALICNAESKGQVLERKS